MLAVSRAYELDLRWGFSLAIGMASLTGGMWVTWLADRLVATWGGLWVDRSVVMLGEMLAVVWVLLRGLCWGFQLATVKACLMVDMLATLSAGMMGVSLVTVSAVQWVDKWAGPSDGAWDVCLAIGTGCVMDGWTVVWRARLLVIAMELL